MLAIAVPAGLLPDMVLAKGEAHYRRAQLRTKAASSSGSIDPVTLIIRNSSLRLYFDGGRQV
jgi:hypothetical protein